MNFGSSWFANYKENKNYKTHTCHEMTQNSTLPIGAGHRSADTIVDHHVQVLKVTLPALTSLCRRSLEFECGNRRGAGL